MSVNLGKPQGMYRDRTFEFKDMLRSTAMPECTCLRLQVFACMHTQWKNMCDIHMYVCVYVCICVYVCMCVCVYVCMYVCMHACMHACMYVC